MGCGCKKKKIEEAAVVEQEVKTEEVKAVETEEKKEN